MQGLAKIAFLTREEQQQMQARQDGPAAWDNVKPQYRDEFQRAAIKQETELNKDYAGKTNGIDPDSPDYQKISQEREDALQRLYNQHHSAASDPQGFLNAHNQKWPTQPIDPMAGVRQAPEPPRGTPSRTELHPPQPGIGEKIFPALKRAGGAVGLGLAGAGVGYAAAKGLEHRNQEQQGQQPYGYPGV